MMEWIKSNLWEIKKSSAVRLFGGGLALGHILVWLNWKLGGDLPLRYYNEAAPMCWSLFESCEAVRFLPHGMMAFLYNSYLGIAIVAMALFFATRLVLPGWLLLVFLFFTETILYIQDFRLSSNEHYLLFILNFVYLFIPNKEMLLKGIIISFYVASGVVRLSPEWLTGQWFTTQLDMHIKLAEWFAALSVLVQLIAPLGLLFSNWRYFVISFLVLVGYHGALFFVDSFFAPSVMLIAVSFFVMSYAEKMRMEREFIYQSFIRPEPSKMWVVLGLALFWGVQSLPFVQTPYSWVNHAGDLLALNRMTDSQECRQTTFLVYDNRMVETRLDRDSRPDHMQCHPYLVFLDLKSLCKDHQSESGFQTVASQLRIRQLKDKEFKSAFEVGDFCSENLNYRDLGLVSWNTRKTE